MFVMSKRLNRMFLPNHSNYFYHSFKRVCENMQNYAEENVLLIYDYPQMSSNTLSWSLRGTHCAESYITYGSDSCDLHYTMYCLQSQLRDFLSGTQCAVHDESSPQVPASPVKHSREDEQVPVHSVGYQDVTPSDHPSVGSLRLSLFFVFLFSTF